ncbi:MAG: LemA family protein [Acidimicrobiales bacterium]
MRLLVAVVVVVALVTLALVYNSLVRRRNLVADGWAGIDVQLARRADLVPNLVATVRAYRDFERTTLEGVTKARAELLSGSGPAGKARADQALTGSLKTLFAVSEAHPDLKADASFLALQLELATLEEDISFARRYYNARVRKFNEAQQSFPSLLVARPMGFRPAEYFLADADHRSTPEARLA